MKQELYIEHQNSVSANPDADPLELEFNLNEIFYSIQGESTMAGERCVFVRLHGCKLRCSWCDTMYSIDKRSGATLVNGAFIVEEIRKHDCSFVEFTGGEPLEQPNVLPLMTYLCDNGYKVAVETGGHIDTQEVDSRVIKILDMKCPDSNMVSLNNYKNLDILTPKDEVKFVLASRKDYDWAVSILQQFSLHERCNSVIFSCVFGKLDFKTCVEWILEDKLPVRFQLQMHKFIWHPETRGV